jgi:cell division protein FtsA
MKAWRAGPDPGAAGRHNGTEWFHLSGSIRMARKHKSIVALDIGTSSVRALAAEIENDDVAITGISSQPSYGVKKGIVINMDSTVDSIKNALEELETMTGADIHAGFLSISGCHIKGIASSGVIALSSREVRKNDIESAMESAKEVVIPTDREVLQIIPQEFLVDDQDGIRDPLGMSGVRLESRAYIITGAVTAAQNIVRCANRSGLKVLDMVLQSLASAEAVLSDDEKELGCALLDIGGGTTDIAVYTRGCIRSCTTIPLGGNQITSDIAIGLRTPLAEAEEIKKAFGHAAAPLDCSGSIDVGSLGERTIKTTPSSFLHTIIRARVEEMFTLIKKDLETSGFAALLPAGVVLTGGTALLKGICEAAQDVLELPVRLGRPQGVSGINDIKSPAFAAPVGIVLHAAPGRRRSGRAAPCGASAAECASGSAMPFNRRAHQRRSYIYTHR